MSLFSEVLQDGAIQWKAILRSEGNGRIDGLLPLEDTVQSAIWLRVIQSIKQETNEVYVLLDELVRQYCKVTDPKANDRQLSNLVTKWFQKDGHLPDQSRLKGIINY